MLQLYLIERKRMNKWIMNLLPLSVTMFNAMIIYRKNTGTKLGHLKFRVCLVQGLLLKYYKEYEVTVPMQMTTQ